MAIVYTPFDGRIPPQMESDTESVITRVHRQVSTSSLTLETIFIQNYPAALFAMPGRCLRYSVEGLFTGNAAVDTKRFVVILDSPTPITIFDQGLLSLNNLSFWLEFEIYYTLSAINSPLIRSRALMKLGAAPASTTPTFQTYAVNGISFDPNIAQSLIMQAQVQNATNSVSINTIMGRSC